MGASTKFQKQTLPRWRGFAHCATATKPRPVLIKNNDSGEGPKEIGCMETNVTEVRPWGSTLGQRAQALRRRQLVALLYRNGGGMSKRELMAHPDCPPLVEVVIAQNPGYFVATAKAVRLSWVDPDAIKTHHARRRGAA